MSKPLLSARGLMKRFGAVVAADNICIDIPAGQRLSVIGSNGAGKTTFVNMVTGYLKPDAGKIALDDHDITRLSHQAIAGMGICRSFQIPMLCLELTALENLLVAVAAAEGRQSLWQAADRPAARDRAEALLQKFQLQSYAGRPVMQLAGGVRKLLDEPTSGVSADEKFPTMERVMAAMQDEAVTILFVEHDMEIVANFSDRVIAFYSGRVIADGSPTEVMANPDVRNYVTGGAQ